MTNVLIEFSHVSKAYDNHQVLFDICLEIYKGEFLTLLGPSGCGKTTILRLISGFEKSDSGEILFNGKDAATIPANLRHVNTVFQSYALFPHMNVYDNVAFGLRCQKLNEKIITEKVSRMLEVVKMTALAKRKPHQLSGGQQQRVAIARALVNEPMVLLLDEPLSSLDYRLRKNMQIELKQLQRDLGIGFVFVTHDQEEALSMSDRVVVMDHGVIQQAGTPREVYENPKNLIVAKFIGEVNVFTATILRMTEENLVVLIDNKEITIKKSGDYQVNDKIHVLIRPEDIRVWNQQEMVERDKHNALMGVIQEVIYKGTTVDLMVKLCNGQLIAATEFFDEDDDKLEYKIGEPVYVNWLLGWETVLPDESSQFKVE